MQYGGIHVVGTTVLLYYVVRTVHREYYDTYSFYRFSRVNNTMTVCTAVRSYCVPLQYVQYLTKLREHTKFEQYQYGGLYN